MSILLISLDRWLVGRGDSSHKKAYDYANRGSYNSTGLKCPEKKRQVHRCHILKNDKRQQAYQYEDHRRFKFQHDRTRFDSL